MGSDLVAEVTLITQGAFLLEFGPRIASPRLCPDFGVAVRPTTSFVAVGLQTLWTRFPFIDSDYCNRIEWNVVFSNGLKCSVLFIAPTTQPAF